MLTKSPAFMCRIMLILFVAVLAACFLAVGLHFPMLLWLAAGAAAMKGVRRLPELWTHGTARLASWTFDLLRHGLLGEHGLIMGRVGVEEKPSLGQAARLLVDPRVGSEVACRMFLAVFHRSRWAAERIIRIHAFCHLLTVAPAGKGKSVSVLVPNLLSYNGSVVCCDPKAELWSLTSFHRKGEARPADFPARSRRPVPGTWQPATGEVRRVQPARFHRPVVFRFPRPMPRPGQRASWSGAARNESRIGMTPPSWCSRPSSLSCASNPISN